jgi:hypothetical protein
VVHTTKVYFLTDLEAGSPQSQCLLIPHSLACRPLSFLLVYINFTKGFHHGISHMHILYFDQINLLHCAPFSPSSLHFLTTFSMFRNAIIHIYNVLQYYSPHLSFFLVLSLLLPNYTHTHTHTFKSRLYI